MLAAFRWRGNAALPGFRKSKGPGGLVELFVSGEAFEVTGAGCSCLVESRVWCPRPVNHCGPWVFSQAREKGSSLPFPGHIWRLRLAMGCKVALPSCTWETSAFPKWLSTGHLALWAPLRGLQCLGGATGWDSQTGSGPVGLRPLRLDRALPVCASVSPLVRWGNF